jgi:putative ABC transport system permease protein
MALLAGILLVANSVSLAMLDRRYEIGVLKTVGYSRGQVLAAFAVEYTLVGVIASVTGLTVVQAFFWGLAIANKLAASLFQFTALSAGAILLCGIGLTLLTVVGVTWNPTRVSPVTVLSERN